MRTLLSVLPLLALLAAAAPAQHRWELTAQTGPIKPVSVQTGVDQWQTWWYAVVTIKNATGAPRALNLVARAETDTKKTARAVYRPQVQRAIEEAEGGVVANLLTLRGELEDGKSIATVVILEDLDRLADRINLHIQGLASFLYRDGAKVVHEVREFIVPMLRRGDEFEVQRNPVERLRPYWVTLSRKELRR